MIYRTDRVIDGPWTKLTFDVFYKTARETQADIEDMLEIVHYTHEVFYKNAHFQPEQCDRTMMALNMLYGPVNDLLDLTARLPETLTPLRYPLLRRLHEVDKILSDLSLLLASYRANCQKPSHENLIQRREMQSKSDALVQGYEGILQEVTHLLDKAHFQNQLLDGYNL